MKAASQDQSMGKGGGEKGGAHGETLGAPTQGLPIVSIVVPFFGLTKYIIRIL